MNYFCPKATITEKFINMSVLMIIFAPLEMAAEPELNEFYAVLHKYRGILIVKCGGGFCFEGAGKIYTRTVDNLQ